MREEDLIQQRGDGVEKAYVDCERNEEEVELGMFE